MHLRIFAVISILLGLAFSFVALELVLRVATPNWLQERMNELTAGSPYKFGTDQLWPVIREDGVFRQFVPHSSFAIRHYEYEHSATIDEFGGRSTPYSSDDADNIAFMGDSFTFGVGVQDFQTFVALISEQSNFRVLNLGVPGSALPNQLDIIEAPHSELGNPKAYVFCMFMGNDLADIRKRYERSTALKTDDVTQSDKGPLWRINNYIFHHAIFKRIYAIQFIRQKLLIIVNSGEVGRINPVFEAMRTDTQYLEESVNYLREELKRLVEISHRLNFAYAIVLIPDVYQVSRKRFELKAEYYGLIAGALEPRRVSRKISAAMTDFEISFVDISECISRSESPDKLYYVQDNHFTAKGHRMAATCMRGERLIEIVTN